MTIAVIGRGLIGSAATRHLAQAGAPVVLVGPDEPADLASHRGVFGSHYDAGRITRQLDADPYWSQVSRAAIGRYAALQAATGVRFFDPVGALHAGPADSDWIARIAAVQQATGLPAARLTGAEARARFPMLSFPDGWTVFHEDHLAGVIDPRALIRAQVAAATRAGARILPQQVTGIAPGSGGVTLHLADGETLRAETVLVAAGGFTPGLLGDAVPLSVHGRTVAFFAVEGAEAVRLAAMPALVSMLESGLDPYLLPPIRYPDGRLWLKIGGDPTDLVLRDASETGEWFRSGGSAQVADWLGAHIRERMPDLRIAATRHAPCVTTFTPQDRPAIRWVEPGIAVATAGCGRGAKCSDELGRLAAQLVLGA